MPVYVRDGLGLDGERSTAGDRAAYADAVELATVAAPPRARHLLYAYDDA